MPKYQFLDQAIDPHARFYSATADDYDAYLKGDYDTNYRERREQWDEHYEHMRAGFNTHIMSVIERGIPRNEMGLAIVGPGMAPVGRELGNTAATGVLPHLKELVVVDFSTEVVRSAMEQIRTEVKDVGNMYGMQFDLTDGFSTAYDRMITERLQKVEDEQGFYDMAEELDDLSLDELRKLLSDTLGQIEDEKTSEGTRPMPDVLIGGKLNKERSLSLTTKDEEVKIDTWFMPMVLAGMGAAAEHRIWDEFETVTSDTERGAKPDSEQTQEDRITAIQRIYNLISRFNTIVATKSVRDILKDNPESRIFAISDVSTVLRRSGVGVLPRLNLERMRRDLAKNKYGDTSAPITMISPDTDWQWPDEPDHHHGVNAFTFYRRKPSKEDQKSERIVLPILDQDEDDSINEEEYSGVIRQEEGDAGASKYIAGMTLSGKEDDIGSSTTTDNSQTNDADSDNVEERSDEDDDPFARD